MIVDVVIILVSILFLWGGAELVVTAASRIAVRLHISELVIGLTVVSIGTSAPEFAVTVNAALKQLGDISVGNIVGSNIFNLGFILGGVVVVHGVNIEKRLVYRDGLFLLGCTLLLLFFFRDFQLSSFEGLSLLILLGSYIFLLFVWKGAVESEIELKPASWLDIPRLLLGLFLVVYGGHLLVEAATTLARHLGVSEWVIGVTIVAAGTSAPEFFTSLVAVIRGHHGISVGNLIGSDIFNVVGVLGLAGVIKNLEVDPSAFGSLLMLTGMVMIVLFFMRTGWKLQRWEGIVLICLGIFRWIIDYAT